MKRISKKKINKNRLFIFIILVLTLLLLFFTFKNFFIEIIKCEIKQDYEGIKNLLDEKGALACVMIILMEALQMVCVFISAEFLQTATAMSYQWYYALLFCSAGIFLGSSIIYTLVRKTKFDSSIFKKASSKIDSYHSRSKNVQMLMYLLFIMPVVPFGAICYYGASQRLSYKRYILTCVSGTIPSIFASILLGKAIKHVLASNISPWFLVLAIVLIALVLLLFCTILIKKTLKTGTKNTPDSFWYTIFFTAFGILCKNKTKVRKAKAINFDGPFIILSNHPSPYDVYFTCKTIYPVRTSFILNRYYFKSKLNKYLLGKIGVIPKKLFSPDMETIKKSLKMVKNNYPIYMCPEGRLGLDGTNYEVTTETSKFIKQLKLPIVVLRINGAYIAKPKWRKFQCKNKIRTDISLTLTKEEISNLSLEELNTMLNEAIAYNDFNYIKEKNLVYNFKNKAKGLENVLYYCPKCHKEHTLETNNNTIKCNSCGFELTIDNTYHFNNNEFNINNIHEWYELIKTYERSNIQNGINLQCNVTVKKFNFNDSSLKEEGTGTCYLTNNEFKFEGDLKVKEFTHKIKDLKALAFSCGEEFECYYDNELYYFYPTENKPQCTKWALIVDELQKLEENNEQ